MYTILEPFSTTDLSSMRGVALVVHGLNLKPERLRPLVDELRRRGIGAVLCSLRGHGENYTPLPGQGAAAARLAAFRQVSYDHWHCELAAAYQAAASYAAAQAVPVFLIAFSLGALLGCDLLATTPTVRFERVVLLAPALALRLHSHLPALLGYWPQFAIRSLSPRYYRANPATPVAAYLTLRTALHNVQHQRNPALNVPTLVFIDPQDELVSARGIRRFITKHNLTHWRLCPIRKQPTRPDARFHHLIIDTESVGPATWQEMLAEMEAHLLCRETRVGVR
ncbi:MAG: alpha/beta fold hydrolase [Caldilineaceae bacterium]